MSEYTITSYDKSSCPESAGMIFNKVCSLELGLGKYLTEFSPEANEYLLLSCDGLDVGLAEMSLGESELRILKIAVLKDYRRQAAGSALMDSIKRFANEKSCLSVIVETHIGARAFFIAKGFVEIAKPFIKDGMPLVEMRLDIRGRG